MPYVTVPIDGGLDLISAPQAVQPGRLIDCQNYEVARTRGVRRIDGYEKFDGGQSPSAYKYAFFGITGLGFSGTPQIGDLLQVIHNSVVVATGFVVYFTSSVPSNQQQVWAVLSPGSQSLPIAINLAGYSLKDVTLGQTSTDPMIYLSLAHIVGSSSSGDLATRQTVFSTISANVQDVPGQGNVNGLFWLKDSLYATRDYQAFDFSAGVTQPNVGDVLYQGASFGAATWTGQVVSTSIISGTFGPGGAAVGTFMVYNTTGTLASGAVNNNTQSATSIFTTTATAQASTGAGLYQAVGGRGSTIATQSWQWCDIGYFITYKGGQNTFVNMNVASQQSGIASQIVSTRWSSPTTPSSTPSASVPWVNHGAAFPTSLSDNDSTNYITSNFKNGSTPVNTTTTCLVTGFQFTDQDIPSTAVVTGLEVNLVKGAVGLTADTSNVVDKTLTFAGVGSLNHNFADTTTNWTLVKAGSLPAFTFSATDYGGQQNLLGYNGITPDQIKNANFGMNFQATLSGGNQAVTQSLEAGITQLQIRAWYIPQSNKVYFWNGVPTITVADGAMTAGSATLTCSTSTPFTASMVGQTITVAGAGVGSALLTATISAYTSSSVVTLSIAASTTVSSAAVNAYNPVIAQVVQFYNQTGAWSLNNAAGTTYLQVVQYNGTVGGAPIRQVGAGEQIRTYPGGGIAPDGGAHDGSTLIATSASGLQMNVMDWSALLAGVTQSDGSTSPTSKYQSVTKNFYASSGYEAIFGVSGGGPAFYFDGVKTNAAGTTIPGNFSRILTGLPLAYEAPRSVVAHQGHLFLGYYTGIVQQSDSSNVLSFDPTLGNHDATEYGFGECVTGLASINGDSLAVWTKSTVQMIQGEVDAGNAYQSIISPTSGGIEYTVQPMANFMYADFRGITMIGATQKYGDFEVGHISSAVSPWLIPRLQLSSQYEGGNIGVINSTLVRNKNQYRLYFSDGYAMTLTFLVDGENPQFTIQKYIVNGTPVTWNVIEAFTQSTGRDRIFGATADGTGNVYELDRGNSFNGTCIPAYATLIPDVQETPFLNKQLTGVAVYGQAQDYGTFQLSRSNEYNIPVQASGNNVIQETFGSAGAAPTGNTNPFVSFGTAPINLEGTAFGIRFDSGTGTDPSATTPQFAHTMQAISYNVSPLAPKQQ